MRIFAMSVAFVALASCGLLDNEPPVPGTYVVTSTLNGALCPGSTSSPDPSTHTWIIAKETSGYSLTMQDDQGNTMQVAAAKDGHNFSQTYTTPPNGNCWFIIKLEWDVSYDTNKISGTNTNTLSMPSACTPNPPCSEKWDFVGTKQ
jgi:hypothetical protein